MAETLTSDTNTVRPVFQQELEAMAGIDRRFLCGPAALLQLSRQQGYDIDPQTFIDNLDWAYWNTVRTGWNRAGLGRMFREQYGVSSVSWWSASTGSEFSKRDLIRMQRAGYADSPLEIAFLEEAVSSLPAGADGILSLVADGCPVATTVEPGFGANKSTHAIVMQSMDKEQGTVEVFDPDSRNEARHMPQIYLREYLSPDGACTIVLPSHSMANTPGAMIEKML